MHTFRHAILASTAGIAIAAISCPAFAQDGDNEGADQSVIIVTSQKREERLQDVPLAVTAVSGDALAEQNITETTALTRIAPSLTYTQGNNPSNSTFRIRGIGTAVFGQGTETSVATVIDGVVLARQAQGFTDLGDIERVEVLRGPQGTLFGKNATAGVINIVTRRPSAELTGRVGATVAGMGEYHLNGGLSGPLSDNIGFRVSGYYNDDAGYIFNHATNSKVNGYETYGFNGKLEFELGDLNLLAGASYYHNVADCCVQVAIRTVNSDLARLQNPVVAGPDNDEVNTNLGIYSFTESQIYSLEANYDLGAATITSISAIQRFKSDNNFDVDGLNTSVPIYMGGNGTAPSYGQFDVNGGPFDLNQFTQELRIGSNGDNVLNYVVGVFYSDLGLNRSFVRRIVSCPTSLVANQGLAIGAVCPSPTGSSGSHQARLDGSHVAAFGQVDYEVSEGLTLIGGLRIQHEKLSASGSQNAAPLVVGDTPMFSGATLTSGTTTTSDDAITGRAGVQYDFSDGQAYATYTRGYKGQSLGTEFNQTFNNNPVVAPENVNAYEVGIKGTTADGLLRYALAAFQADYTNLQVQANRSDNATGNFLFVVTNAGKARTRGIEFESTLMPTDNFSVDFNVTYIEGRFDADGLACPLANRVGTPLITVGQAAPFNTCVRVQSLNGSGATVTSGPTQFVRDGVLPNTPEWRIGVSPRYEQDLGDDFSLFVDLNLNYQSEVTYSLEQDPGLVQGDYFLANLTLGVRPQDRGFSASVFIKNLFDQRYYGTVGTGTSLTSQSLTPGNLTAFRPKDSFRYLGASIGYTF